jgi:hypothetical protein
MRRLVGLGCRVSGLFLFVFINVAVSVLICICFTANLRMGEKVCKKRVFNPKRNYRSCDGALGGCMGLCAP